MKKVNTIDTLFGELNFSNNKLTDRFLVPPFSVLDTKQGYWQSRRREWIEIGIKSELGRGDNLTFKGLPCFDYNDAKEALAAGFGRDANFDKEKFGKCLPEIGEEYGRKIQATSIFDPVLCELAYRWFSNEKDCILDPFAGGSVRGIVAAMLDRNYTGVDLSEKQIDANYQNLNEILQREKMLYRPNWIWGDSININLLTSNKMVDFIFSCPPYYDLEVYSNQDGDISNCETYDEFLELYEKIIYNACKQLNNNRFACFVVGNMRDKNGFYHDFAGDTIRAFAKAGLKYYNEGILVNVAGTLPVRINKQFNSGRKLGKQHQTVLVFYKGDAKNIKERYGEVIIE